MSPIACIGWGSLLWRPESLPLGDPWRPDGPELPIEFARISADGRLTLIIHPPAPFLRTYWAPLAVPDLAAAVEALAARELCSAAFIGRWSPEVRQARVCPQVLEPIATWAVERQLHGVVWTDLPPQFEERAGAPYSERNALTYLARLEGPVRDRAATYIRRAPAQTRTPLRSCVEQELGWTAEKFL